MKEKEELQEPKGLSPTDKLIFRLIEKLMIRGVSSDEIIEIISDYEPMQKTRTKRKINKLIAGIKVDNYFIKKEDKTNNEIYNFLNKIYKSEN